MHGTVRPHLSRLRQLLRCTLITGKMAPKPFECTCALLAGLHYVAPSDWSKHIEDLVRQQEQQEQQVVWGCYQ